MEIMDDIELTEAEEIAKEIHFDKLYDVIYKGEMENIEEEKI